MLRLKADSAKAVETFVTRVVESGTVWVLDDGGSVAGCTSHEGDADVFPVFSDAAYAKRGAACWDDMYPAADISLEEFTDSVLPFAATHGQLIGPNWDANMAGAEVNAGELLARIIEAKGG